jgi:hypothetical protein
VQEQKALLANTIGKGEVESDISKSSADKTEQHNIILNQLHLKKQVKL